MSKARLSGLFALFLVITALGTSARAASEGEGALEYKNYIIRYDRGWDILCDPYEVHPNDWVLKIFRQKGEIAHDDFRDFLGIFMRLNPYIKDIDRIRPGQVIDIPLKKLQQGALPGQASGIVTIPFVSINSVVDLLSQNSSEYVVQQGDCVSKIVAERFGIYGSKPYSDGLKMFQALNPHIKDLDRIISGQRVYVPDPSVREQPWYGSIFDQSGHLVDRLEPKVVPPTAALPTAPASEPKEPPGSEASHNSAQVSLAQAAAALEGKLLNKGTYYFPLNEGQEFELDLSKYPLIELETGSRFVFTNGSRIMEQSVEMAKSLLPDVTIVQLPNDATAAQVIESMMANEEEDADQNALRITDYGAEILIRAKWIETSLPKGDDLPRQICISPIKVQAERTPESIVRYLEQHNIILREVLPANGGIIGAAASIANTDTRYSIAASIAASDQKEFVRELADAMGYRFASNVDISFPYAGIQVKALSNMLSSDQGNELLIDFGDLYGDAIDSIKKSGLKVTQISADDDPSAMVRKILDGMNADYTEDPTFMAADRPESYNTSIKISGYLVEQTPSGKLLLSSASLHHKIAEFLESTGLNLILLGQSRMFY
jgi:hypothetical protein